LHRISPEFQIEIPEDRVAQQPSMRRGDSRLLVVDRSLGGIVHIGIFSDIVHFLTGDLLILNETRVLPAQVEGNRRAGGRVKLLFLSWEPLGNHEYAIKTLIRPSNRLKPGARLSLPGGAGLELGVRDPEWRWSGRWSPPESEPTDFEAWLEQHGQPPLPPYIRREPVDSDRARYQTVYARVPGSLAAPTAGLHFTPDLMSQIEAKGAAFAKLTLDVGLGTFKPIIVNDLSLHKMGTERFHIPAATVAAIKDAQVTGRKVTAVGTTVVRALESAASPDGQIRAGNGEAGLFIYPPYQFRAVERLVTNFHRPDSTLLQLVAALMGWDLVNLAYGTAVEQGFHFYSYGDAMLIL
jgi:S-adenosylmethionine:tRNA ribosyltransferase-isomerase